MNEEDKRVHEGLLLKSWIKSKGWSQQRYAEHCGRSRSWVMKMIECEVLSKDNMWLVLGSLEISSEEFYHGKKIKNSNDSELLKVIKRQQDQIDNLISKL